MPSAFSTTFVKLRRRAGFETAYAFFHKNGGRKGLGCSFPNYLRIENGSHLPKPARLPRLCALLRLPLGDDVLRELVSAYLESLLGSKELREWMLAPFARADVVPVRDDPAGHALRRIVQDSGRPVSVEQLETLVATPARYWCYRILTTSRSSYSPADLARTLKMPLSAVQEALPALVRVKIARRVEGGRYTSPLAGQFLVFPDPSQIPSGLWDRVFEYNRAMVKKHGRLVDMRWCGVRADERQIEGFIPYFREAVRGINAYAVTDKTERSGLFFVEGRIYKLMDF